MRTAIATLLAFVVIASVNAQAPAVRRATAEDSMRGFNAFYVEAFVSEYVSNLVPASTLTREIEEQLRQRGLVVAVRGNEALPLSPTLIVDIDAIRLADATIVYTARVDFRRDVQIGSPAQALTLTMPASTWSTSIIATATDASANTIKLAAHDLVDRFLGLHARANR